MAEQKKVFYHLTIILFLVLFLSPAQAQNSPQLRAGGIDTAGLDLAKFANQIIGTSTSNFEKAEKLLHWLSSRMNWLSTDYKQRTVKEILARNGGNCFELAKVYMAMIKECNISYRPIAEINVHQYSEERQKTAEAKVKASGYTMSVFGRQHNDHRWVEVFDDRTNEWVPVDPTMDVMGTEQWLKARAWFGERKTLDTSITNAMIVPFAIFVVSEKNKYEIAESRTMHYLRDGLDALYGHQLSKLSAWKQWVALLSEMDGPSKLAFEGKENLHLHSEQIAALAATYEQLRKEYLQKQKPGKN